jgi:hypothetical protein
MVRTRRDFSTDEQTFLRVRNGWEGSGKDFRMDKSIGFSIKSRVKRHLMGADLKHGPFLNGKGAVQWKAQIQALFYLPDEIKTRYLVWISF